MVPDYVKLAVLSLSLSFFLIRKGTIRFLSLPAFIFLMKSYVDFGLSLLSLVSLVQEGIEFQRRQTEKSAEA